LSTGKTNTKGNTKKTTTKSSNKSSTKPAGKAASKTTGKTAGKTTGKAVSKTTKKAPAKTTSKTTKSKGSKAVVKESKHYYEIKLILLFAFTVLSGFSLHTEAVGMLGSLLEQIYLGLFGYFGYFMPYLLLAGGFLYMNPNFLNERTKNVSAVVILCFLGMLLNFVTQMDIGIEGEASEVLEFNDVYTNAINGEGAGIIGHYLGSGINAIVGRAGIYIICVSLCLVFLVLTTRFKISSLLNKAGSSIKDIDVPTKPLSLNSSKDKSAFMILKEEAKARKEEAKVTKNEKRPKPQKNVSWSEPVRDDYMKSPTKSLVNWMSEISASTNKSKKDISQFDFQRISGNNNSVKPSENQVTPEVEPVPVATVELPNAEVNQEPEPVYEAPVFIEPVIIDHMPTATVEDPIVSDTAGYDERVKVESEMVIENNLINEVAETSEVNTSPVESVPESMGTQPANQNLKPVQESVDSVPQNPKKAEVDKKPLDKKDEQKILNQIDQNVKNEYENYKIPKVSLLKKVKSENMNKDRKHILERSKLLEDTLNVFGVQAKVIQISRGPAITRYEIELKPGTKMSKIVGLSDDIALNLATQQVRIAAVPGKAAVGIELPNKTTQIVSIREVLESESFKNGKSKLSVGLGKDIAGQSIIADLGKMPHTLIAGATGSGKSVCINTIIISLLCNTKPDEVKLLMVDPKVVELNNYNGIPHLILPVVTDPKKASVALNWAVQEMTKRYNQFAENGVRDIDGFNNKFKDNKEERMARIVVIIDELADLMMVAPNQVEDAICRLAQMARAAGIHLIVATQRPSVDVITGVIKANIPSRIAFSVSSQVDSRTILDMGGAEKLLGKGDMLYYPSGAPKPMRVQGAFISDEEVESIVSFIKEQAGEVSYQTEILETTTLPGNTDDTADEFLQDAIKLVVEMEQASISMLQRKFRVGYNRAARLIDSMEERGIVGPSQGSKPRAVLISKEEMQTAE